MRFWLPVAVCFTLFANPGHGHEGHSTPAKTAPASTPVATRTPPAGLPSLVRESWNVYERSRIPATTPPTQRQKTYLPDTAEIARVGPRVIRAGDVRSRYYDMPADSRSKIDSLGRVEFVGILINKDVTGLIARRINPPLGFEQRTQLRIHTSTSLQNTLYQRMVVDSIEITEEEVTRLQAQFNEEVRIRRILLDDLETAQRVRRELSRRTLTWAAAVMKYSQANDSLADGDLGWYRRSGLEGASALAIWNLATGAISEPLQDSQGYHLIQLAERRVSDPPPARLMRRMLIRDLRDRESTPLVRRMYGRARAWAQMRYDSSNVAHAISIFKPKGHREAQPPGVPLRIAHHSPRFSTEDRERVIATTRDKSLTLGAFLEEYSHIPAVFRRPIVSLEPFRYTFESLFLAPYLTELAVAHGLENDPMTELQVEERREKLLVEMVYADSVESRIRIDEKMRRAEYDREVKAGELTTPLTVRYALIIRHTRAGVDSVLALLKSGVKADTIVAHDERTYGKGVSQVHDGVYGRPNTYTTMIFEELKPGQSTAIGPDAENKFLVIHVDSRKEEHTPTYDESINAIDESTRNIEADRLFRAFLQRHRGDIPTSARMDRVMQINLNDPLLD